MRIGNIVFLLLAALCFANAIELALVREDPADIQQDAQETEAAEGATETKSTDKVGQAEADLKSTRSSLHGGVNAALESAAKAADVAVNNNGKNFSDHLDSSKAIGDSLSGKLDELASKRARVSKLREERRKSELRSMRPTGATGATGATEEPKGVALPKVIYKGPPTDLLEKHECMTNNQVKQDNEYQKAQLNLQKKRMAAMGMRLGRGRQRRRGRRRRS